jgi:hypothetical protein
MLCPCENIGVFSLGLERCLIKLNKLIWNLNQLRGIEFNLDITSLQDFNELKQILW